KMKDFDSRRAARITSLRVLENDMYFYFKTRPQDQQPKLYYRQGYKGEEILLFDPETYEKGKVYTISGFSPNRDGSTICFGIAEKGAELGQMLIMEVKTKKILPEKLQMTRGSGDWLADDNSFTYTPYKSNDLKSMDARQNLQSTMHKVGTPQSEDKVVFSSKVTPDLGIKPEEYPYLYYDRDTKLIYGGLYTVDRYVKAYYAPVTELAKPKIAWKPMFKPEQEVTNFISDEQFIYFITSKNTPRQKMMRMPVGAIDADKAETMVPENADEAIDDQGFTITKDGVYFVRTKNGVEAILYFVARGTKNAEKIALPNTAGSIVLLNKDAKASDLWVSISGWTTPNKRYRYTAATKQFTPEPLSTEIQYPEFANLTVEELMIPSHDGVMVPVSVVYDKKVQKNGSAPVMIYGYGAYAASQNPFFSPPFLLWTQQGGIFAVAHVRGGGELGEAWHKAGQKTTKPNTWKDLIATAEYLIKNKYTLPQKIAISGGSAGGILIGRAMTERPDLFAAAIPEVGCMNAVRMENSPNGPVNVPEFGTVAKEDECKALIEMDAYLHLKEGEKYPATLVTAGFNDPRVIAWQPAKFAARLLASNKSDKPVLFFTDYEAGHGIGDAKQKQFEALADLLAFGLWQTGHPNFQLKK
ncbi:MAG: prolyl oligopeptidase family serine peptidase, partial [Verrucomicrobia bacterium]|nr:prolyl oligopeptidase family serine peptidase [Cytophagales bacterium]